MKPARSLLSTPGNRPAMLAKALTCGADAIVADLQDSVPAGEKEHAREAVRELIERRGSGAASASGAADAPGASATEILVRANSAASGLLADDVAAIVAPGLAAVQLPQAESPGDVLTLARLLDDAEAAAGLAPGSVEILVSLESAIAVLRAFEILSASPRVVATMPGIAENGDLEHDLGAVYTPDEVGTFHARAHVLLAARAAKLAHPVDGVYARVADEDGFVASATLARRLGYRGKKVIHPRHVPLANRIFQPTAAELDFSARVLAALDAAEARGGGATVVDGRMVDVAMAATARQVLAWGRDDRDRTAAAGARSDRRDDRPAVADASRDSE
ncbi:CoA ester lyase [Conexibacter sp. CPCC 206217]|uniref:HpcH/HpaI aldolase/citrate lyase family protein n=1 Tax=Conexibacter sp. CPCC 206217 TaxID=3064574 RepID=UPI002721051B|nr:aldolase/citrate lyase family protein [Conexibacter sp. CPCC 206217]MDO8211718.1 aldolase/citrate lyase family protein [Conexibacter sp. CPCC 206217]